jgi:hypothetical protein
MKSEVASDDRIQMIGNAWEESRRGVTEVHVLRSNIDVSTMRPTGESINPRRLIRNFRLLCWRSIAEQVISTFIAFLLLFATFSCIEKV